MPTELGSRRRVPVRLLATVLATAVALAGCSAPGSGDNTPAPGTSGVKYDTLHIVTGAPTLKLYGLLQLAQYDKLFEAEGFAGVDVTSIEGDQSLAALVSGSADVGLISLNALATAGATGESARKTAAIMQLYHGQSLTFIVSNDFVAKAAAQGITPRSPFRDRIRALQGATVAISAPGSAADLLLRAQMTKYGLNPNTDANFSALRTAAAIGAAISIGRADIGATDDPLTSQLIVEKKAVAWLHPLDDIPGQADLVYSTLVATKDKIAADPEELQAAIRALLKARDELINDKAGSETKLKTFYPDLDDAIFQASFEANYGGLTAEPNITDAGGQATIDASALTGKVEVSDIVDNSLIDQVLGI